MGQIKFPEVGQVQLPKAPGFAERARTPFTAIATASSCYSAFFAAQGEKAVTQLDLVDIDPPGILAFLSYLEKERKNGVSTRNVRLSATHALFQFIASRNPEHLELAQRVLGIPFKRARQRVIDYLEYEEIDSILKAIDRTTTRGARDYALIATMFNTGARVKEIADLRFRDLQLEKPFQVRLFGKGRKERYCPIWSQTASVLRTFCQTRRITAGGTCLRQSSQCAAIAIWHPPHLRQALAAGPRRLWVIKIPAASVISSFDLRASD